MPESTFSVEWNGKEIEGLVEAEVKRGITRATLTVLREVKIALKETSFPPPSEAGDVPHARTGILASSYQHEFEDEGLTGIVGSGLKYARHLEFGTQRMAARPHLTPTFNRVVATPEKFFNKVL